MDSNNIRNRRAPLVDSGKNSDTPVRENFEAVNDSVGELIAAVEQTTLTAKELLTESAPTSPEVTRISQTEAESVTDASELATAKPVTENPELSKTDPSPESSVDSSTDSSETAVDAATEIIPPKTEVVDEKPSPPTPTINAETSPVPQLAKESPAPDIQSNLKGPLDQPDREAQLPHPSRGKGTIETIEEICRKSLEGINSLIIRSNERDTETIRQLEFDRSRLEKQMQELVSERDDLSVNCNNWDKAYKTLESQLKDSAPYEKIFSRSLPAWLSLEKLASLLNIPAEDGTEFKIDQKVVWRILPTYVNLVDELKSGTLAPRQLTSATDAFSEAVCALFEGAEQHVANWHECANEHLKPAGYSFMILAVGTQIDNDLVTGSIQGKTTIGTIKRMPLIKDGGDVIRKADVTGI